MPDGFIGRPAYTYLKLVEEAHELAIYVINQSPFVSGLREPSIIRLPYDAIDARSGHFSTGHGNSGNIVSNRDMYYEKSYKIYDLGYKVGVLVYRIATKIEHMTTTDFKLPQAVPKITLITSDLKRNLTEFEAIMDDFRRRTLELGEYMSMIGEDQGNFPIEFVWNEGQAEEVRARSEAALRDQANELTDSSVRFRRRADELIAEAERIEARLPIQKAISHIVWREYRDVEGNEQSYEDTQTEWVTDHPATSEARAQAQELREQARELRRVALEFVRTANQLQDEITTTNHKFRQMHQEALEVDTRYATLFNELKSYIGAFTHRMQSVIDSFSIGSTSSSELLDAKLRAKSSLLPGMDLFGVAWDSIYGTRPRPTSFLIAGVVSSAIQGIAGFSGRNNMSTGGVPANVSTAGQIHGTSWTPDMGSDWNANAPFWHLNLSNFAAGNYRNTNPFAFASRSSANGESEGRVYGPHLSGWYFNVPTVDEMGLFTWNYIVQNTLTNFGSEGAEIAARAYARNLSHAILRPNTRGISTANRRAHNTNLLNQSSWWRNMAPRYRTAIRRGVPVIGAAINSSIRYSNDLANDDISDRRANVNLATNFGIDITVPSLVGIGGAALGGGKTGGAAGTAIMPGKGTVVGAVCGFVASSLAYFALDNVYYDGVLVRTHLQDIVYDAANTPVGMVVMARWEEHLQMQIDTRNRQDEIIESMMASAEARRQANTNRRE
ncbi:MAG: hypothetical protein FWE05_02655 [Defluviitaleaceae bacterium]|nr:hypothetical protein [Defluviitaleaceae bacterium]